MFVFSSLAGLSLGALIVAGLSFPLGPRGVSPTWRGYLNAVAAGLALAVMVDLLPAALDMVNALLRALLQAQVISRFNPPPNSPLDLAMLFVSDAVRPFGGIAVLFLYLSGNSLPMMVEGRWVGMPAQGWRAWLRIPAAGETDWKGAALVTIGLAAQNLWLGQMRGALAVEASTGTLPFLFMTTALSSLRAVALFGPLVEAGRNHLGMAALAMLVGASAVTGLIDPEGRGTILLGAVPLLLTVIVLPIALGRMLRVIQKDIGLGWRTTAIVLGTLVVARILESLNLSMVQGVL